MVWHPSNRCHLHPSGVTYTQQVSPTFNRCRLHPIYMYSMLPEFIRCCLHPTILPWVPSVLCCIEPVKYFPLATRKMEYNYYSCWLFRLWLATLMTRYRILRNYCYHKWYNAWQQVNINHCFVFDFISDYIFKFEVNTICV